MTALSQRGIRLILRMPSRAPGDDKVAAKSLDECEPLAAASQEFSRKWQQIIRVWAQRYGTNLAGWYFDGAYNWSGWDDDSKPYNFRTWAEAARAGNPNAVLTFNSRKVEYNAKRKKKVPSEMDYMPVEDFEWQTRQTSRDNWVVAPDTLWHAVIPFAGAWGADGYPGMQPDAFAQWLNGVVEEQGTISIDVGIWSIGDRHGYIPPWQMATLAQARSRVREQITPPLEIPTGMIDLGNTATFKMSSTSRYNNPKLNLQIFTTGATLNGEAFVTDKVEMPLIQVTLAYTSTIHRIELYRAPTIDWNPEHLTVSIWDQTKGPHDPRQALAPASWTPVWQANEMGWKWILNIPDGLKLRHFAVGLSQAGSEFKLGRIKIYGDGPDYEKEGLPKDWASRQKVLAEIKAKEEASQNTEGSEKKKKGFSLNPFR